MRQADEASFGSALVTGASSGLGRGLALHYALRGVTVYALARRLEALEALAAEAAARGGTVVPWAVDVSDAEALAAAVARAEAARGGALDLVVANAGVGLTTPGRKPDWRAVKGLLDVNVTGAAVTLMAALPAMLSRGRGTLVAVSSLAGFRGLPGHGAYCASKAALHTFMESLRVDLAGTGVRALTVYPGFVETEMTARNRFPMPFLMRADRAVAIMARGIDRGDELIAFPARMAAVARAIGALPRAVYEPLARSQRRRSAP